MVIFVVLCSVTFACLFYVALFAHKIINIILAVTLFGSRIVDTESGFSCGHGFGSLT